jgi:hypothetical protein
VDTRVASSLGKTNEPDDARSHGLALRTEKETERPRAGQIQGKRVRRSIVRRTRGAVYVGPDALAASIASAVKSPMNDASTHQATGYSPGGRESMRC